MQHFRGGPKIRAFQDALGPGATFEPKAILGSILKYSVEPISEQPDLQGCMEAQLRFSCGTYAQGPISNKISREHVAGTGMSFGSQALLGSNVGATPKLGRPNAPESHYSAAAVQSHYSTIDPKHPQTGALQAAVELYESDHPVCLWSAHPAKANACLSRVAPELGTCKQMGINAGI